MGFVAHCRSGLLGCLAQGTHSQTVLTARGAVTAERRATIGAGLALVTRVKRKMREGKILIPLRELVSGGEPGKSAPSAVHPTPPQCARRGDPWQGTNGDFAPMRDRGGIGTVVNA
jgi:hypothetical protein